MCTRNPIISNRKTVGYYGINNFKSDLLREGHFGVHHVTHMNKSRHTLESIAAKNIEHVDIFVFFLNIEHVVFYFFLNIEHVDFYFDSGW